VKTLVTGSSGSMGRVVAQAVEAAGHEVVRLDVAPDPLGRETLVADLADPGVADSATAGCGAIIHLAAWPHGVYKRASRLMTQFEDKLLRPNVIGMLRLLDAAAVAGSVKKVVLASTMQITNGADRRDRRRADLRLPTNDYALTKLWMEDAGEMVSRMQELPTIAVRIGWFPRNLDEARMLLARGNIAGYLSHDDTGRFFVACVENDWTGFHKVTLHSRPRPGMPSWGQPELARDLIGFEPQDVFPEGSPFDVA
jgi:nucleoside-diphosphate-sugar epimerase